MENDKINKKLKKEIAEFKATGKLPEEYDVVDRPISPDSSPYWEWVDRFQDGNEPLWNSGDQPITDTIARTTNKGERFREWLTRVYPTLSDDARELFRLYFEKRIGQSKLATYYGVSQPEISRRIAKLKHGMARFIGL